jgi:SAM-dependent methyltransferase
VCALALSHLRDIAPAIAELGRILRPGGRLVISNPHPFATGILGWRAGFTDEAGARVVIPEYPHLHGDYVAAFAAAGLMTRRLIEPVLSREQARTRPRSGHADAFEQALTGAPVVIVWEAERR